LSITILLLSLATHTPATQAKAAQFQRYTTHIARAAEAKAAESVATVSAEDEFIEVNAPMGCCYQPSPLTSAAHLQVNLKKPLGLKFGKGNDGGIYVSESNAQAGNTDARIMVPTSALIHAVQASVTDGRVFFVLC
jgi:hypothetical protein